MGPRGRGHAQGGRVRPHPRGQGVGPWSQFFRQYFLLIPKIFSVKFQVIPRTFISAQNNTMAILLKTASVRVSSIQIMQVRVQNKGKSVWKSRYDGDVSNSKPRDTSRSCQIKNTREREIKHIVTGTYPQPRA